MPIQYLSSYTSETSQPLTTANSHLVARLAILSLVAYHCRRQKRVWLVVRQGPRCLLVHAKKKLYLRYQQGHKDKDMKNISILYGPNFQKIPFVNL